MADPGWYADPSGLFDRRYWDGARWTEHVEDHANERFAGDPSDPADAHDGQGGAEGRMTLVRAGSRGGPTYRSSPGRFESADIDWADERWTTDDGIEDLVGPDGWDGARAPSASEGGPAGSGRYGVAPFSPRDFTGELRIMEAEEPVAMPGPGRIMAERVGLPLLAALAAAAQTVALTTIIGIGIATAVVIGAGVAGLGLIGAVGATARIGRTTRLWLRSEPVDPARSASEAWLAETVSDLAAAAGIRPPAIEVFLSDTIDQVTAAPSRNRGLLAITTGAVRGLHSHEVRGLLAYGVARVARGDAVSSSLISGVGDTLVSAPSRFAASSVESVLGRGGDGTRRAVELALQLTVGLSAQLVAAVDGRRRVGRIDGLAAALVGSDSVVSALILVRDDRERTELPRRLATMAIRPSGIRAVLERPLATHPEISLRIATLE